MRIPVRMVLLVGSLAVFGPLCIDTYLPALPAIGRDLHAGASAVQASITACLSGSACGQLLVGPISDRLGRRRPLIVRAWSFFVLASAGCIFAPNVLVLIALRFLQGLGAAAGLVTGRAVVRDQYTGIAAARFFSLLMMVTGARADPRAAARCRAAAFRIVAVRFHRVRRRRRDSAGDQRWSALPETLPPEARHSGGVLDHVSR